MTNAKAVALLRELWACENAVDWALKDGGTAKQLWERCDSAQKLFWFADKIGVDRSLIALAGCDCARTALRFVPEGEERPRLAIEAAEGYVAGTVTKAELEAAGDAAYAAGVAAYTAWDAAYAAVGAADAANLRLIRKRIPWDVVRDAIAAKGRGGDRGCR